MTNSQVEVEETATSAGAGLDWLQVLEDKVHAAAGRIQELREENAGLRQKIEELEEMLSAPASTDEAASQWVEEKEEIRGRVSRLVEHLEGLL